MLDTRQAIRIGLIVNELATNALKHAFPGEHQVRLQRLPTRLVVIVEDDGIGCPEDEQDGLGSRVVSLLAQQSGGTIKRESANPGCRVVITMSPPAPEGVT